MSHFGTFKRTKVKKNSIDQPTTMMTLDTGSSTSAKNSAVFSSTPNLYKIDQSKGKLLQGKYNNNDRNNESSIGNQNSSESKWSFMSRRTSSSTETWTGNGGSSPNTLPNKKSSSMKSFLSLMNVVGTLKRSKSIRKLGWSSTLNLQQEVSSTETSHNKDSVKSKTKSRTSSKSEEYLNDEDSLNNTSVDSISIKSSSNNNSMRDARNTEPGVISSGSSSENSSVHDSNSIRTCSGKSDILEESDDENMEINSKDPQEIERIKTLLLGTKKFNMDPKKGIEFLVDKGILTYTPRNVAAFLKDGTGLGKKSIGNYLGERNDFNEQVLKEFVELHDFKHLILVQALRQFLWSFRLPGESQKISRMLDAFAERYCQNNPGMFSVDTCSVLCYSIIMLNTELHNPNVKEKATVDQFIKRNRGIEGGELLSPSFMISLYNSILQEPFRFPEEDGNDLMLTFFNPDYEGWLYKFGGRPKSWKRLWFILSNNCLYFFKFTTDKTPRGIIPLENILVKIGPEKPGSKLYVMILYKESPDPKIVDHIKTCKTLSDGQTVPKLYSSIQLGTQVRKERERWIRSINANHSMSSFYSDLTLKKMKAKSSQNSENRSFVVRKSQISLPATVLSNEVGEILPIPDVVLKDPKKDPNNFFSQKNLSSISLASSLDQDLEIARPRSRSESRIYDFSRRSKSKSPSVSSSSHPADSRDEDLDSTLTNDETETIAINIPTEPKSPRIPTDFNKVELRTETVISDRFKKLSMIQEQLRSDSVSSESSESASFPPCRKVSEESLTTLRKMSNDSTNHFEESSISNNKSFTELNSYSSDYKIPSEIYPQNTTKRSAEPSPIISRKTSTSNTVREDCDDNNCDCSIEIIDCSNADVKSKTFSTSTGLQIGKEQISISSKVITKVPEMCFDNIYESNV